MTPSDARCLSCWVRGGELLRSYFCLCDNQTTFIGLLDRKKRVKQILMDCMQAEAAKTMEVACAFAIVQSTVCVIIIPV